MDGGARETAACHIILEKCASFSALSQIGRGVYKDEHETHKLGVPTWEKLGAKILAYTYISITSVHYAVAF